MKSNVLKTSAVLLTALSVLFVGCKQDDGDPVDLCSNGVQDPGEQGVDCGGTCTNACPVNNALPSSIDQDTTLDPNVDCLLYTSDAADD